MPAAPDPAPRARAPWWRRSGLILNLLFLVIFAWVLSRYNLLVLRDIADPLSIALIAAAVAARVAGETCSGLAWRRLARLQGIPLTWQTAVRAALSAQYLARVTPGRVGEFIRVSFLMHHSGRSVGLALSSVLAERMLARLVSLTYQVLGAVAFIIALGGTGETSPWWGIGVFSVAVLVAVGLALIYLWRPLHERLIALVARLPFLSKFSASLRDLVVHYHAGLQVFRQRGVWWALPSIAVSQSAVYVAIYCIFQAWNVRISFAHYLPCLLVAHLVSRLGRLSFMGVGTNEVLTGVFLGALGYPARTAVAAVASVTIGYQLAMNVLVPLVGLGVWLLHPVPILGRRPVPEPGAG